MIVITTLRNIATFSSVCGRTEDQDKWHELNWPDGVKQNTSGLHRMEWKLVRQATSFHEYN